MLRPFAIAGCALLLALPLVAQQQDNSAPASQSSSAAAQKKNGQQKKDQQRKPSAAEANPFPEAQSEKAAQQTQPQDHPSAPAEPNAPAPQQKKSSTAEQNPFPESQSEKAARQDQQESRQQQKDQQQPQSSQPYSSSQDSLKGLDLSGSNDARTADGAGGTILSPELARKDTKVGHFYLQTGDFKGAYDRFVEATKVDPTNADAVFGLAEAARHLNQRDQAIRNYRLYLSALPDGPHAKDARKALKDMGAEPNP